MIATLGRGCTTSRGTPTKRPRQAGQDRRSHDDLTDGDFRRSALNGGTDFLRQPVENFMTRGGKTVPADALAVEALKIFQQFKISDLFAVDAKGRPKGYIDVQDLPKLKML